jgi:hypothetical protein
MQNDYCPLRERQRGESIGHRVGSLIPFGLRVGFGAGVGGFIQQIDRIGDPATGHLVERPAGHDPVQPGRERGLSPEPGQVLPRRDQGFLGDVLGVVVITA